jgi:hypothetical protein
MECFVCCRGLHFLKFIFVFSLNQLIVGRGCVLKSGSRLLSGANMDGHAILLEHTLILAGETVEAGSVWQGWPSQKQVC